MNKKLLALLAILLGISQLMAAPVDESIARRAGGQFAQTALGTVSRTNEMRLVMVTDAYFVYNVGQTGFVIVSADDRFRPIVGYSDEGTFPVENPSPEMLYYLNDLSQRRHAALKESYEADAQTIEEWTSLLKGEPMPSRNGKMASFHLMSTKWNQNAPYNKFCPKAEGEGRAYAGCVATAMSQVMNYWKHPSHGYGNHSYMHYQYGELSANFGETQYDFDLMPNSIYTESPVENIDAIALFMYHCGIAVDMGYGADGSGAMSEDVPEAVMRYFGYTNGCRFIRRNNFTLGGFQKLLKDQFDLGWPCYYSGQDEDGSGGHAFVCDGYDDNDMFHFNWGWSGSGDGFYAIDELNVSSYAFNDDQGVVMNFVPAEVFLHTASAPNNLIATPNGDMNLSVTLSWTNPSTTLEGKTLDAIDQMVIMRDKKVIHTIDHPVPGEAMSFVDPSGQPMSVNYTVHAVCEGYGGRKAHADGINLGPTCEWTVRLYSSNPHGETLTFLNSSGGTVAELVADSRQTTYQVEIPQGRITMRWTPPTEQTDVSIEVLDAEQHQLFAFIGLSTTMPQGTFFEMVNTCGGEGSLLHPSDLKAQVANNDVFLSWKGVPNPGYGYIIYRDDLLYDMVSDTTCFTDPECAQDAHSYFVTAFCLEGETDPSNTVCAILNDETAPRNFDAELLENKKVKLTWERPVNDGNLAGYTIYRRAWGEEFTRLKLVNASNTTYTDAFSVKDGSHYFYRITAVYNPDLVESTPAQSLKNPDLLYVEINRTHIPTGLTLEEQDSQHLLLRWEPAMLADSYNLYCNGQLVASGLTDTQYVDEIRTDEDLQVYYVTGIRDVIESSPSNKVFYGAYAVGENAAMDVALFPNPAKDAVTVQAEGLREITVFNINGQQVLCRPTEGNEQRLDLRGLGSGVYYFMIRTDQGIRMQKVVLVK